MGVPGLLALLYPLMRRRSIKSFAGMRAGIDGHVWLHRSLCGRDSHREHPTELKHRSVQYMLHHANNLKRNGILPIFIFDGASIGAKLVTEASRRIDRDRYLARAIGLIESGHNISATEHFSRAADVTFGMVQQIIQYLRHDGFDAFVAPFEADAQLTYLIDTGCIDIVITEDSDLAVYGSTRIIFKYDPKSQSCLEFAGSLSDIPELRSFSTSACRAVCILAGCDYGPEIRGIGIKSAIDLVARSSPKDDDINIMNKHIVDSLSLRGVLSQDRGYLLQRLRVSQLVFSHQTVFDREASRLRPMRDLAAATFINESEQAEIGKLYNNEIAEYVHFGYMRPDIMLKNELMRYPSDIDMNASTRRDAPLKAGFYYSQALHTVVESGRTTSYS